MMEREKGADEGEKGKNKWLNDDGDVLLSFGFWFVYDWANCKDVDEEDCKWRDKKISLSLFCTVQVV